MIEALMFSCSFAHGVRAILFVFCLILVAQPADAQEIPARQLRMFKPLPAVMDSKANPITDAKVDLGRMLYYDPRLSKSQTISCNTCHLLDRYGVDNKPTSDGHRGLKGDRNSPTVYNAAGHFRQFWDGRAADIEEQAKGPVTNPVEMAMPGEEQILAVLHSIPEYVERFRNAFPGSDPAVTFDNFARAVGAFERKLVTPSRWDEFLAGREDALTASEKQGFLKFAEAGCPACHMGAYLGGTMYQKLGLVKPWPDQSDLGRYRETQQEKDKMFFKVPSLRNIVMTAPYYHDGGVGTLEEAVALMGEFEMGRSLSSDDIRLIVVFLNALTGEIPAEYVRPPALPASTASTPKPDMSE